MDGRKLNVVVAVPRQKASELKQKKDVKDTKDKRNLWLIREGSEQRTASVVQTREAGKTDSTHSSCCVGHLDCNYCCSDTTRNSCCPGVI